MDRLHHRNKWCLSGKVSTSGEIGGYTIGMVNYQLVLHAFKLKLQLLVVVVL